MNHLQTPKNNSREVHSHSEGRMTVLVCLALVLVTVFVALYKDQFAQGQKSLFDLVFAVVAVVGVCLVIFPLSDLLRNQESLLSVALRKVGWVTSTVLMVAGITLAGASGFMEAAPYPVDALVWAAGCLLAAVGSFALVANPSMDGFWKKCIAVLLVLAVSLFAGLLISEPIGTAMQQAFHWENP